MSRKRATRHGKGSSGLGERPSREYNSMARDFKRRRLEIEAKELDTVATRARWST